MIKSAALGASATLIAASEGRSQEQDASAERPPRPTPVINAVNPNTKKPMPLAVIGMTHEQEWKYKLTASNVNETQLNDWGGRGWEAVCVVGDKILFKMPILK
jgi:hypothetical protein